MSRILFLLFFLPFMAHALLPVDQGLKLGDPAPETLGSANGKRIELADYRGKVVVVSFWASWCAPCREEFPVLEKIQRKLPEQLQVFVVSYRESRRQFHKLRKAFGKDLALTMVHDRSGALARKFGVKAIPNLFIFSREGKLVAHEIGYGEGEIDTLLDTINCALAGKKTSCQQDLPPCVEKEVDGKKIMGAPEGHQRCWSKIKPGDAAKK